MTSEHLVARLEITSDTEGAESGSNRISVAAETLRVLFELCLFQLYICPSTSPNCKDLFRLLPVAAICLHFYGFPLLLNSLIIISVSHLEINSLFSFQASLRPRC